MKYLVKIPQITYTCVEIEAESEQEALKQAMRHKHNNLVLVWMYPVVHSIRHFFK